MNCCFPLPAPSSKNSRKLLALWVCLYLLRMHSEGKFTSKVARYTGRDCTSSFKYSMTQSANRLALHLVKTNRPAVICVFFQEQAADFIPSCTNCKAVCLSTSAVPDCIVSRSAWTSWGFQIQLQKYVRGCRCHTSDHPFAFIKGKIGWSFLSATLTLTFYSSKWNCSVISGVQLER